MKNIAFCNYYDHLNKDNLMFEKNNIEIGDNLLAPMIELKKYAQLRGINVGTVDVLAPDTVDTYVFLDMPDKNNVHLKRALEQQKPIYLIILESILIRPENYDQSKLLCFKKVFTYDDSLIDNDKFFKLNYAFSMPKTINKELAIKQKLCTMIVGNKYVNHPLELYSKRMEAIRWFEKHHPEDFDFYGVGWDEYLFKGIKPIRALNRVKFIKKMFAEKFTTYRGKVERKKQVMEKYRFAICYENARDVAGYITEKIFDCFFAGCVPVYWGANNIANHIPRECFIDKREFASYDSLYKYMVEMKNDRYLEYLHNIEAFLNSAKACPFSCSHYAKTLLREILN